MKEIIDAMRPMIFVLKLIWNKVFTYLLKFKTVSGNLYRLMNLYDIEII